MLQPNRMKFRKQQKGRNTGIATNGNKIEFGDFGLKATGRGRLTARQIEAARRAMTRHVKRGGRIWIRIFPDKPITEKAIGVRMQKSAGQLTKTSEIKRIKTEIARAKTILAEKKRGSKQ